MLRLRTRVSELEQVDAERASTEQRLRRVNAKLSALLENTDDFILFSDREGKPLFYNSAYAAVMKALLGIEMQPGLKPHELLPDPQARAQWDEYHRRVLSGEKFKIEYAHPLEDGSVRHFEVRYNPVRKDGETIGFSEFTRDITERKLAELALRHSNVGLEQLAAERQAELHAAQLRNRALAENTTDIISILDRDWCFSYTAPSVRRYGFEPEDVVGRHASDFAHPDDYAEVEKAIHEAIAEPGRVVHLPMFRVVDASGKYIELDGRFTCLYGVEGIDGVVFNGRDITERRALEDQLRHVEKMDAIGQLAGGVAHDFNNQLTGILASADLLRMKLDDPSLVRFAEQIVKAARRSAELTGQLLAFARKGASQRIPTDINQLLSELASLLERSVDKRIEIELALYDGRCSTIGDPTQIHNALLNLALNARDAMPNGGHLSLRSELVDFDGGDVGGHEVAPGPYIRISVSDDGAGMDEATKRRAFEPFFTTKPPGKGTGMGLASVYGTAQNHNGTVVLTSAPSVGTSVALLLPVHDVAGASESKIHASSDTGGGRLLVVDDEEAVREVLAEVLETMGYTVEICGDGAEAVEIYRRSPDDVDVILLDMIMPRMDGHDALVALRELDPAVRVLMMSGHTGAETVQGLLDTGATGFIRKPFDIQEIQLAVERAVSSATAPRG
jgi:PAS domain S-box-containing protein